LTLFIYQSNNEQTFYNQTVTVKKLCLYPNASLTSDIDISFRWIPSKHFQVTDIFTFISPCWETETPFC